MKIWRFLPFPRGKIRKRSKIRIFWILLVSIKLDRDLYPFVKILYTNSEKFKFLPFLRIFSRSQFNLHPKFHRSWISLRFEIKRFSKFAFKILEYCSISHGERSFEFVPFRHHERVIKIFDDTSKERKKFSRKSFSRSHGRVSLTRGNDHARFAGVRTRPAKMRTNGDAA